MPAIAVPVDESDEEGLVDAMVEDDELKSKASDGEDGSDVEPARRRKDEEEDGRPEPGSAARITFIVLGSLGFFNVYALRVNLSIALISMVKAGGSKGGNFTPYCGSTEVDPQYYHNDKDGEFDWDEPTQGLILGSFFWGYIFTQIPGGIIVKYTGSKWVIGLGCFITAIFSLLTPIAARYSVPALIAVRVVEGLGEGVTFPAMHALIAKWAPPLQRSMFSAIIYGGATAGLVISMPVSGLLAESNFLGGWPSVFYVFGLLGAVWFFFWAFLVFEDPDSHPWISASERRYIKNAIGHQVEHEEDHGVPYRAIFTSLPFWAILVAHVGQNWGFYTLLTQLPTYVKNVLGFDVGASGFVSALPYLCLYIFAVGGSAVADCLRKRGTLSTTAVRKTYTACAFGFAGFFLALVSFLGCDVPAVIAIISMAGGFDGLTHSGFNVNHIDIAPNYAGVLLGFTNCAATVPGIVAPYVTGRIIDGDQTVAAWRTVFMISAAVFVAAGVFYVLFASGEEQPWNRPRRKGRRSDDGDEARSAQKSLMVAHSDDENVTF